MSRSRFDGRFAGGDGDGDPMAAMATLVDVMLVFACGLVAAIAMSQAAASTQSGGQDVQRTRDLPEVPQGVGAVGGGYRSVGRVFRDPQSGKLILVESGQGDGAPGR